MEIQGKRRKKKAAINKIKERVNNVNIETNGMMQKMAGCVKI